MDYLSHRSTFSFATICTFCDYASGTNFTVVKRLQSAQQRVADMISVIGPLSLANPDVEIDFSSDESTMCVNVDGDEFPPNLRRAPLWAMCEQLQMLRPDRAEILLAIQKSVSTDDLSTFKRLIVLETCMAAGKGEVVQSFIRGPLLVDVVAMYNFFVGRQDGLYMGLKFYLEGKLFTFRFYDDMRRTFGEYH